MPSILLIMITSRPPQGGWIEIFCGFSRTYISIGPAPHRAGGLKYIRRKAELRGPHVPPPTGRVD